MGKRRAACVIVLALAAASGCGSSGHSAKNPAPPSGSTGFTALRFTTLNLGIPDQALKAPVTGRVPDTKVLHVGVTLKISDAQWKQFGHGKSPAQGVQDLGQRLGVSQATIQKIQAYLASAHIRATPSKTRTSLTLDVSAGTAARLLRTSFVTHRMRGRTYFTPDAAHPPQIPAQLAPYILAVTGLDSYSVTPRAHALAPASARTPARAAGCMRFPAQAATNRKLAAAYGYDRLWSQGFHGEHMTVNLVEMDGYDRNDIATYAACTGSHVQLANVDLGAGSPTPGGEATLDIEMLAGLAPNVRIVDYEEDPALLSTGDGSDSWTAFNNALQRIIDDNTGNTRPGSVVSISLGGAEGLMSRATMQAVDQNLRILTQAEHMTVFVATGDCGAYGDRIYGPLDVSFPSTSQWVVAVGGTRMRFGPNGARTGETVWSDRSDLSKCVNQWGSGGGVSKAFRRPPYQQADGANNRWSASGGREVPDVSAAAIELPVFYRGRWAPFGGTSAATPIWAAGMALVDQALITQKHYFCYGPDTFYHAASVAGGRPVYNDVVTGDNLYYPATNGYDLSTGLGTPNLPNLLSTLTASPA